MHIIKPPWIWLQRADDGIVSGGVAGVPGEFVQGSGRILLITVYCC